MATNCKEDGCWAPRAYLEIVWNEWPKFTLQQPPGERETQNHSQAAVGVLTAPDDKGLVADDSVLASPIGMESSPEEGGLAPPPVPPQW